MAVEHPGKRSDPGKLARDREAIRKAQQAVQVAPQTPNVLGLASEVIKRKILVRKARRMGYGAAPQKAGAAVLGTRRPDDAA